uniref:Uncharacterized protein n=1 Tax=Anguilla anguilla TaxID=7936 RepID=A0A0E9RAE9_ANGAN
MQYSLFLKDPKDISTELAFAAETMWSIYVVYLWQMIPGD